MQRIVVGADGSAGSANAIRWAAELAGHRGAEVVVMSGFLPTDSELPPGRVESLLARQREHLDSWCEAALGDHSVRTIVERGDPRPGILAVAEREDADLIVVGRVGTSAGPGLLHVGSVAEWLAHHADRPIAVVGGAVNLTTHRVLVGVDGSAGSRAAVNWVRDMRADTDIQVVAASVDQALAEWTPSDSPDNWRHVLERRIRDDYAAELAAAGFDLEVCALAGVNIADTLLQAAAEERVDLIVVGTRGLGGFSGLRIGGVALKALHRANRTVVLVPPA